MKLNILGSEWNIEFRKPESDSALKDNDGYTDVSIKKIVIAEKREDCEITDFDYMQKENLRHEIIHAFLFESGLGYNIEHKEYGHEETMIDWLAIQSPKIFKAFKEVGCL